MGKKELLGDVDVIVIGAGIAGVTAANRLKEEGQDVIVLEARDRIGGRIHTDKSFGIPLDLGAAWIHGPDNNPLSKIAKKLKMETFLTDDDSMLTYDSNGNKIENGILEKYEEKMEEFLEEVSEYVEELDDDISLWDALKEVNTSLMNDPMILFQLSAYYEFDFGAPMEKLSAWYWEDDEAFDGDDVILLDGYKEIINHLAEGLDIKLISPVKKIEYEESGVIVYTEDGFYEAYCAIICVPLGILKNDKITFSPELSKSKRKSIKKLEMGNLNKIIIEFEDDFWPNKQYFGYLSEEKGKYSYFVNGKLFTKKNILITFGFGNYADKIEKMSDEEIQEEVIEVLKNMFGKVSRVKKIHVTRWKSEPYTLGAYSFNAVGASGKDFDTLAEPESEVLFFAGEHTSSEYRGTVHGAYLSGLRAAKEANDFLEDD